MKKLLLVAAFGVAGVMSAKGNVDNVPQAAHDVEWCGTVTFMTSCGFPIQDSYCTSWGVNCLIESINAFNEYFC